MSAAVARPMVEADVPGAARASAAAFELDISAPAQRSAWEGRIRHALVTDPDGAFVSEAGGEIAGVAQAIVREGIWILSLLTVDPAVSEHGHGRALVNAALSYATGTHAGIIIASNDPKALRLYASSGFRLEPTFEARGRADLSLMPPLHPEITAVEQQDLQCLEPISRAVRGAAHTPDLALPLDRGGAIFRLGDRGFVITLPRRGIWALAALDEEAAKALLWYGLHQLRDQPQIEVSFISGRQQWALEVLIAARIPFRADGGIALRGNPGPFHPYIPSPPVS